MEALAAYLVSAKGAVFIGSLGQRPRESVKTASAESAIHSGINLYKIDGEPVR